MSGENQHGSHRWRPGDTERIDPVDVRATTGLPLADDRPARRGGRHAASGFGPALGLTVLGAVVPGTAFLAGGRRRLGAAVLTVFLLLLAGGVWLATVGWRDTIRLAVDSTALLWVIGGICVVALAWLAVVVTGYLAVRPRPLRGWQHAVGGLVVLALCLAVVVPAGWAVRIADAQRDLVDTVFADGESATVTDEVEELFGDREELNILLLGGDGGEGREGVRTDTVIVANIQVETGATTLFSLPRNLEELPFPADSPLGEIYPDGFDAGSESESLLNAVYRNGPAWYPDVLGPPTTRGRTS